MTQDGELRRIEGEDYLHCILRLELLESVPSDVKALFEVARGAMIYGYFFYPLYTLATEQLFRVVEAAVLRKCKDLEAPKSKQTFQQGIEWLISEGIIPVSAKPRWDAVRQLRNSTSHPNSQSIITPGIAIELLEKIARQVNSLFNGG